MNVGFVRVEAADTVDIEHYQTLPVVVSQSRTIILVRHGECCMEVVSANDSSTSGPISMNTGGTPSITMQVTSII